MPKDDCKNKVFVLCAECQTNSYWGEPPDIDTDEPVWWVCGPCWQKHKEKKEKKQ
jgi:hypothetical protein